ncbi:MAG: UDP-N-acetylmuramoyl-tripeptide--D-alanyl-D-alanine ligase [Bacteroides sp.]|nr:UDP-N-acetylmuramoyl-tripeptide--D-alanyl-D-alanine ligase [Bacteroides sp.]MCM1413428.1 UDP-N-acetylmuramoyl-tripeptide--D-alanyl-D-alanine ligase [Bacteroides sp.]MCM1471361.1 UDP-N-acetylmuramoyl-tripeptide--D-alanyl-D-alanine ligase [Bacteroides sp.]
MTIPLIILFAITIIAGLFNLVAEYSRVMMMMQQNSYRIDRYRRWLKMSGDSTSYPRLVGMIVFFAAMATFMTPLFGLVLIALFCSGSAIVLIRKKYKKPIVWTPRVRRIFAVMCVLSILVLAAVAVCGFVFSDGVVSALFYCSVALIGLYCVSHIVVMAAVWILAPVEKHINRGFYNEAASILASMPLLKVVGITGSYGKTSTKHYLHRILSEHFETLMTPGSYNTTLGVIRTVREMMKPYCEVFICEMGAKQSGDIKEICDLVHPHIGIVTAVGPQHLESFKTIENVQATKFELVDALPSDGLAIVNNDFPMIASRKVDNVRCIRYGVQNPDSSFRAVDIVYSPAGTDFTILGADGLEERFHTPLVGECNVSNLLAAVVCAIELKVPLAKIRRAVERIEPVEHRLSMKRTPGGLTILDDAFNSNPSGSKMALDVLAMMNTGRRIVITPGMIELGDEQYELNRMFGAHIARSADVAIVVGQYNREAIVEGIRGEATEIEVHEVGSFAHAQQVLVAMARRGDVVLYENDLPDTFK